MKRFPILLMILTEKVKGEREMVSRLEKQAREERKRQSDRYPIKAIFTFKVTVIESESLSESR